MLKQKKREADNTQMLEQKKKEAENTVLYISFFAPVFVQCNASIYCCIFCLPQCNFDVMLLFTAASFVFLSVISM